MSLLEHNTAEAGHEDSLAIGLNRLRSVHRPLLLDAPALFSALRGNLAHHRADFCGRVLDSPDPAGVLEVHAPNYKLTPIYAGRGVPALRCRK